MKRSIAILALAAMAAYAMPAQALTLAEGQQQHADAKAAGYNFVSSGLSSVGTLKVPGSDAHVIGFTPSANEHANTDEPRCGYWDTVIPMPGNTVFCIPGGEFTDDMNRGHNGGAISEGGPLCTTNTVTFTVNPAADRAHAVSRSDSSTTSSGGC